MCKHTIYKELPIGCPATCCYRLWYEVYYGVLCTDPAKDRWMDYATRHVFLTGYHGTFSYPISYFKAYHV